MAIKSPNYTQTPNTLFDEMMSEMGLSELKVVLAAIRITFGYHRDRARCSLTRMQSITGLTRQGVLDGAEAAERRGILTRVLDGGVTEWVVNTVDQTGQHSRPELVNTVDQTGQHSRPPSTKENIKQSGEIPHETNTPVLDDHFGVNPRAEHNARGIARIGVAKSLANGSARTERWASALYEHFRLTPDWGVKSNGEWLAKMNHAGRNPDDMGRFSAWWRAGKWGGPPALKQIYEQWDAAITPAQIAPVGIRYV